jgi:hypothetical protein
MTKQDGKPQACPHMKGLLSGYADENLTGISRWYTRLHLSGCPQCTKVLEEIIQMLKQLRALKSTPDTPHFDARAKEWEAAFDAVDKKLERD